jgi:hypothetical protein
MPRGDGTGPCGNGAGSGRRNGLCLESGYSDLSIVVVRLVIAHWRLIAGVLLAFAAPVLKKRLVSLLKDQDELPVITVVKESSRRLIDAGKK